MPEQDTTIDHSPSATPLLQPGRNCWRIEHADRFALLVDAEAYFRAVRDAIRAARHSVFILSWDIDSRTLLMPGGAKDGYPEPLGEFLHAIAASRPELQIYVLNWDFAMLYALEREWLPAYKLGWKTSGNLSFQMDARHPIGGSHHQKVVVIDDALAFVGGLDLTRCRWDTPEHACSMPLRRDVDGKPHAPFHDVQAMVDGRAARALGELVRQRWRRATGQQPVAFCDTPPDVWPAGFTPDLTSIDVGIARTEPAFEDDPGVHEVRQLHADAIASARRHMFFENQYFTSGLIGDLLSRRLAEEDGPEVIVISPQTQSGWLEQATMGLLRARLHRRLKAADRHRRYRMYCPHIPGLGAGCLNVHSKVFAIDDDVFCVGSANLSSRSMALDTECNLVIEAQGSGDERERIRAAIARMRNRLLAEHLDVAPEAVAAAIARHRSLHETVEALHKPGRTMQVLDPVVAPELDALIPEQALFDPETPIEPEKLMGQFVPREAQKPVPRRLAGLAACAILMAVLAVAWRWSPLREWLNLGSLVAFAHGLEALPFTPIAIIGSYIVAGVLVVPVTLLIAVTGIVFGPLFGTAYAVAGTLLSAAVTFGIGNWLGHDTVERLVGPRINKLSKRIAKRGIMAMVIIRMLPVAPFTVVNVVAGASHIRFRDFMAGTFLGMLPGIAMTVTFVHHLVEAIRNPSVGTVSVMGSVAALILATAFVLQRVMKRKGESAA